jgi:hypothetical protein
VPMTLAEGYSSAKSIAQIPVPVPMSRTFWMVLPSGARCSLFSRIRVHI